MKNSACALLSLFLGSLLMAASSSIVSSSSMEEVEKALAPEIGDAKLTEKPQIYLVFVKYPRGVDTDAFVNKILQQALGSVEAAERALIYRYKEFSPMFAARLSLSQVKKLQKNPYVEAVERDTRYHLLGKWQPTNIRNNILPSKIGDATEKPQVYLVFIKYPQGVDTDAFVNKILQQALGSVEAAERALIYHYKEFSPMFAARLSLSQVKELQKNPYVEAVERDRRYHLLGKW